MSNGFIRFLTRMMYLSACYAILCHATQAVTHKGTSKKRRCRKVCIKEFEKLKLKVKELEEKLERILLPRKPGENFPFIQGPKGDRGPPGPQGPRGPKGDCGTSGLPGSDNKGVPSIRSLPKCTFGEYITSDGKNLYCVKLINNPIPHTPPRNLPDRQPSPTLTAEKKVQLKFIDKPVQTMSADSWDVHSFTWNQNTYLGITQLNLNTEYSKTFTLYKWVQNVFVEKADLTIPDTRKWTSFEWEGHLYIVIACYSKPGYSYIYKMATYDTIEEFQKLETNAAFAVDTIIINGQLFIAFAYFGVNESQVFKWTDGIFVKHHKIPTAGSDIDAFFIGSRAFLAVVGTTTKDNVAYLFEYKNGKFVSFRNIRTEIKPYGITHIMIGNEHFLAIAQHTIPTSMLCRWNGETFQEMQKIDSCKARDFAFTTTYHNGKSITYMAVVNEDEKCRPVVYVYEKHRRVFVKLQEIESTSTRDVEFLSIPNSNTLYLAAATAGKLTIYRESGS